VNGTGLELVSPVLNRSSKAHRDETAEAMRALRGAGAVVDTSCGLHVHHSLTGKGIEDVAQAAGLYTLFQEVIDTVLPPSRVGTTATGYARPMTSHAGPEGWMRGIRQYDWDTLVRDGCYNFGRYHGVNLNSIQAHGTLEFRQHSGTLNGTKIDNWSKFTRLFVDANANGKTVEYLTDTQFVTVLTDIGKVIGWLGGSKSLQDFYLKRAERFAPKDVPDEEDVSEGGTRRVAQAEEEDYDEDDGNTWCESCGEYH
jgi:hypothetical protein